MAQNAVAEEARAKTEAEARAAQEAKAAQEAAKAAQEAAKAAQEEARREEVRRAREVEEKRSREESEAEARREAERQAAEDAAEAQKERERAEAREAARATRAAEIRAEAAAAAERERDAEERAAAKLAAAQAEKARRAGVARKRRAEFPSGMAVHRVKYGCLEGAPWLQLLPGDGVLLKDCPAPGYAAWAVVVAVEADGAVVMRDLSRHILHERKPPPGATSAHEQQHSQQHSQTHSQTPSVLREHASFQNPTGRPSFGASSGGPRPGEPITPPAKQAGRRSSEGPTREGEEGEPAAPEGYWQENACLPLRCDPATGSWGLPVVMVEEILFGLTAEDYTKLDYASERPPHHVDYRDSTGEDGVEGTRQAAGWRSEPETQILVSARREIGCWSAAGAELEHALSSLWPHLARGYAMIPGRPSQQLPGWKKSFLKIPEPSTPAKKGGLAAEPAFFSSSEFVGLI